MKDSQKFIGLDVSKDIISVGIAEEGRGEPRFHGNIQNTPESIRKLFKKLHAPLDRGSSVTDKMKCGNQPTRIRL